jgi:putative PIN family toxin of toxin-antitoxin system
VRAVLDTNVLVSGIFFGGPPGAVLDAWAHRRFEFLLTPLIFDEYLRTCVRLSASYPGLEYHSILATIAGHGVLIPDPPPSEQITPDPDDDKFILCAYTAAAIVVSGDRHLLTTSGWEGLRVIKPRDFLSELDDLGSPGTGPA